MSVLINMEMPTSCHRCPMLEGDRDDGLCHAASRWLDDDEYWRWYQYPEGDIDDSKPANCPLVPVPKHGDLIDRDDLKNKEITIDYDECDDTFDDGLLFVTDLIDNAPTIIPAEEGE